MRISHISNTDNFKGYDARPLRGVIMNKNCLGIADEIAKIGEKEGFKVFSIQGGKLVSKPPIFSSSTDALWAQDYWTILKTKLFSEHYNQKFEILKSSLDLSIDFTEKIAHQCNSSIKEYNNFLTSYLLGGIKRDQENTQNLLNLRENVNLNARKSHIQGGNLFIIKGNEKDELIIGEDDLKKFDIEDICAMYNVDKVTVLPQMDFHIDLFIRPLDNKRILLADDNLSLDIIKDGCEKLKKIIDEYEDFRLYDLEKIYTRLLKNYIDFSEIIKCNPRAKTEEIEKTLTENGYEVIKVPGRIYKYNSPFAYSTLKHLCNYINGLVLKNDNDEIVYITNHTNIEKILGVPKEIAEIINFNVEDAFSKSIEKYVDKNHIYFVDGKQNIMSTLLTELQGGVHCLCSEIPDTIKIKEEEI